MFDANDNLKICHLLLQEANIIQMPEQAPANQTECINLLNEKRSEQHWPLASGMSPLDVDLDALSYAGDYDFTELRAILQNSLIAFFKKQDNANKMLNGALQQIQQAAATHVLGIMAGKLQQLMVNLQQFSKQEAILQCLKHYDLLLKDWQHNELKIEVTEKLFLDISFYQMQLDGKQANWSNSSQVIEHLEKRIQFFAKQLADILKVPDNETTLAKEKIMPLYLSLSDGLLFAGHFELRARLEARLQKLGQVDDPMLLIAVPVQRLWAECARIGVSLS
jgi:hypothetical protein